MSSKISLTPSELKAQAAEMKALQADYERIFNSTSVEFKKANNSLSANISKNFSGKIIGLQKNFLNISSLLENGNKVANSCAVSFESVDSALSKLFLGNTFDGAIKGSLYNVSKDSIINSGKDAIKSVDDISKLYEKYYDKKLTDGQKAFIESIYKGILGETPVVKDIPDMIKFLDKVHKKDYVGATCFLVDKAGSVLKSDGSLNYTGLKIKTVAKTFDLVLKDNGYIQINDEKYQERALESLSHGDILGTAWNMGGNFIQTVGKGTVDISCQLVSDTIDGMISKATGGFVTLSGVNSILKDTIGWSPGHIFNSCTKAISGGVDVVIDKGGDFFGALAKQSYSDLAEFGDIMGKAGHGIIKGTQSIASAIGKLF